MKMTSIRECLETGTKEGHRLARKMLMAYYGQIPLCHVETKLRKSLVTKKTVALVKCSWLSRWYTEKVFRSKCINCQGEMLNIIMENE